MDCKRHIDIYENSDAQELIGYIPNSLHKWGVYIIAIFIIILLSGSYFIQYPDTLKGKIVIPIPCDSTSHISGILYLSSNNLGEVKLGNKVLVFTEAYPESKYGYVTGRVNKINGTHDDTGHYQVEVLFPNGLLTSQGIYLSSHIQLCGTGEVILKEKRLIENFITPLNNITDNTK